MPVEIMGVTLYNLREVADKLGVSYLTAKTYHTKCRFKGQRIGRSILVSEDELQRFVNNGATVTKEAARREAVKRGRGMFAGNGHEVDDFMRERHEEGLREMERDGMRVDRQASGSSA